MGRADNADPSQVWKAGMTQTRASQSFRPLMLAAGDESECNLIDKASVQFISFAYRQIPEATKEEYCVRPAWTFLKVNLAVQRLLPMAEPSLAEEGAMMLEHKMLALAIQRALTQGRPRACLAEMQSRNPYDLTMALSMLLVAVDEHGTVLGALMALPPVRILGQFMQAGVPMPDILAAAQSVIKLKAVAVDPAARGLGIGTALINLCTQLYTTLGWRAVYGQIDKRSDLEPYYSRLGFTVLLPCIGLDFSHLASFPLGALPLGGERLFVRWLDDTAQPAGTVE